GPPLLFSARRSVLPELSQRELRAPSMARVAAAPMRTPSGAIPPPPAATCQGTGPTTAQRPAPSGPADAHAASPSNPPATGPATAAAPSSGSQPGSPRRRRRASSQPAVIAAANGAPSSSPPAPASGPDGSPARTGRAGIAPTLTSWMVTTVSAPTANPGPRA